MASHGCQVNDPPELMHTDAIPKRDALLFSRKQIAFSSRMNFQTKERV